jgi:uncharacterized protein YjiS (DUF1127 family)
MHISLGWNSSLDVVRRKIHAYVAANMIAVPAAQERHQTMFLAIVRFIQSWKKYNTTLRELSRLSDRELTDAGISRSDIPRVAWESASR